MIPVSLTQHSGRSIGDSIYAALRENIILLQMRPGESINIKEISEQLGVSRSPVRDAVMKLAKEGLVDIIPQKGTSVSRIDLHRVEEERFMRESMEEKALELFGSQKTLLQMEKLRYILRLQKESLDAQQFARFLELDDQFHGVFFEGADRPMCWEIYQSMSGHYRRIRLMTLWDSRIVSNAIDQHWEMLQLLEERKLDQLPGLLRNHCRKLDIQELDLFESYPEYFQKEELEAYMKK
ncbi:MAG: GntR family transcriptional regulator [Eubacteriales bacterium]|jgi:DNA-binding GntR family transcriptional regulator